jgi:hypothetical protein
MQVPSETVQTEIIIHKNTKYETKDLATRGQNKWAELKCSGR